MQEPEHLASETSVVKTQGTAVELLFSLLKLAAGSSLLSDNPHTPGKWTNKGLTLHLQVKLPPDTPYCFTNLHSSLPVGHTRQVAQLSRVFPTGA